MRPPTFGINMFGIVIHVHEKTRMVLQGILLQAVLACGALGEIMEMVITGVKTVREEFIELLQHGGFFLFMLKHKIVCIHHLKKLFLLYLTLKVLCVFFF